MQFLLLIYENEAVYESDQTGAALQQIISKHGAFSRKLGAALVGGSGLQRTSSATTVRTAQGKQTLHDGPFAESKEQLGGYYLIDVPDLDAAIAIAKQVPVLRDGSIEVRPLLGPS